MEMEDYDFDGTSFALFGCQHSLPGVSNLFPLGFGNCLSNHKPQLCTLGYLL